MKLFCLNQLFRYFRLAIREFGKVPSLDSISIRSVSLYRYLHRHRYHLYRYQSELSEYAYNLA